MIYKKDYYGYVYRWTNMLNNKAYIVSHYGSVEDKYTGSGINFKPEYDRNPENFRLEILEFIKKNCKIAVLRAEQKWLDQIPNIINDINFYNASDRAGGGWNHITKEHIQKRATSLKNKHKKHGLSLAEKDSYKNKIQTRINRISNFGFTKKEQEQHTKYGCKVLITLTNGEDKIFNSFSEASRILKINVAYGYKVCCSKPNFKNYIIKKLANPIIDCRSFKIKE